MGSLEEEAIGILFRVGGERIQRRLYLVRRVHASFSQCRDNGRHCASCACTGIGH